VLVPNLKSGDYIVMDNASFHKGARIQQIIEQAGCKLIYLPAYSPDLNPIEHFWFSIKNAIKKSLGQVGRCLIQAAEIVFAPAGKP
jgi:transposase